MDGRRGRRANIQGPHSALTDFLAANNISAAEIRESYERRLREAARNEETTQPSPQEEQEEEVRDDTQTPESPQSEADLPASARKRKRQEIAAAVKLKRKQRKEHGEDSLFGLRGRNRRSLPGQIDTCEACGKRFTVTAYCKTGPQGGLLCPTCSRETFDGKGDSKPKLPRQGRKGRRQNVSNIMDGIVQRGAFSLLEMCIKVVADNIHDIEEFGDLPLELRLRLSQILSKRRALNSRTLGLFLRQDITTLDIYDCAKLEEDDFAKTFAYMPFLRHLNLRFAGQLKNKQVQYLAEHNKDLQELQLDSCNLVSNDSFKLLFEKRGPSLTSLKLSNLDCSLDDDVLETMAHHCRVLRRLKIADCWLPGDRSLKAISTLSELEHLSLSYEKPTSADVVLEVVEKLGPRLKTLSLRRFDSADDRLLEAIHQRCSGLEKLRFSDNDVCTDKAYSALFNQWDNKPLRFVDLSATRDIDNTNPDGPAEPVGLASDGFKALMQHSGEKLESLNISACRHISHAAFQEVFDSSRSYRNLKVLDVSFITVLDDFLMQSIFKCCPALRKVVAFACFNVREATIPPGIAYIGGLNAHNFLLEDASGARP